MSASQEYYPLFAAGNFSNGTVLFFTSDTSWIPYETDRNRLRYLSEKHKRMKHAEKVKARRLRKKHR
jgi:hypothetical protein